MYYANYEFRAYFLKFLSFFWPNLDPRSGILQTDCNLAYHRDILLYVITVLMFISSKCSRFNFLGKFGLKILLQLMHAKSTFS